MEVSHNGNMYNLYSKKIAWMVIACLFLAGSKASGQYIGKDNHNYLSFNRKSYYFGLTMGMHTSGYRLNQSSFFVGNENIRITEGIAEIGINLHIITNLKIGQYFDFRFLPGFAFSNRTLEYTYVNSPNQPRETRTIESVFFEMPFALRFKSEPYKDKRGYVLAGIKYSYDVSSNAQSRMGNTLIRISPHDFQYEVGFGVQFFFPYFIFSPEIKYSRGMGNILLYNNELNQSRVLEQVVSEIFTLSFHFEG
ncbi:MAG TPA: outer membrane beta-barrel protein [Saprospiraceae bacterium]|nr:outer membrane beta-barrel protein [Saprospiraceae bacterium]